MGSHIEIYNPTTKKRQTINSADFGMFQAKGFEKLQLSPLDFEGAQFQRVDDNRLRADVGGRGVMIDDPTEVSKILGGKNIQDISLFTGGTSELHKGLSGFGEAQNIFQQERQRQETIAKQEQEVNLRNQIAPIANQEAQRLFGVNATDEQIKALIAQKATTPQAMQSFFQTQQAPLVSEFQNFFTEQRALGKSPEQIKQGYSQREGGAITDQVKQPQTQVLGGNAPQDAKPAAGQTTATLSPIEQGIASVQQVFGPAWQPAAIFREKNLLNQGVLGAVRIRGTSDVYTLGPGGSLETERSFKEKFGSLDQKGIVGLVSRVQAQALGIVPTEEFPAQQYFDIGFVEGDVVETPDGKMSITSDGNLIPYLDEIALINETSKMSMDMINKVMDEDKKNEGFRKSSVERETKTAGELYDDLKISADFSAEEKYKELFEGAELTGLRDKIIDYDKRLETLAAEELAMENDIRKEVEGEASESYITALAAKRAKDIYPKKMALLAERNALASKYKNMSEIAAKKLEFAISDDERAKLETTITEVGGRKILVDRQTGETIKDLGSADEPFSDLDIAKVRRDIPQDQSFTIDGVKDFGLKAPTAGKIDKITIPEAKAWDFPFSMVGLNQEQVLSDLNNPIYPPWFEDMIAKQSNIPFTSEELQNRWDEFRQKFFDKFEGKEGFTKADQIIENDSNLTDNELKNKLQTETNLNQSEINSYIEIRVSDDDIQIEAEGSILEVFNPELIQSRETELAIAKIKAIEELRKREDEIIEIMDEEEKKVIKEFRLTPEIIKRIIKAINSMDVETIKQLL